MKTDPAFTMLGLGFWLFTFGLIGVLAWIR